MEPRGRPVAADSAADGGAVWGEGRINWSPQGSYLTAYSKSKDASGAGRVTLWGGMRTGRGVVGTHFANFGTFTHTGDEFVLWAPCERCGSCLLG